jgi:hypothetical protein
MRLRFNTLKWDFISPANTRPLMPDDLLTLPPLPPARADLGSIKSDLEFLIERVCLMRKEIWRACLMGVFTDSALTICWRWPFGIRPGKRPPEWLVLARRQRGSRARHAPSVPILRPPGYPGL